MQGTPVVFSRKETRSEEALYPYLASSLQAKRGEVRTSSSPLHSPRKEKIGEEELSSCLLLAWRAYLQDK